jgi:hypothetical protein
MGRNAKKMEEERQKKRKEFKVMELVIQRKKKKLHSPYFTALTSFSAGFLSLKFSPIINK